MHITVEHAGYYEWDPVPTGTVVTDKDITAMRVKPSSESNDDGSPKWLMRVSRKGDTHTTVTMPESEVIAIIIADAVKDGACHSRPQAAAVGIARNNMDHHAHRKWIKSFTVEHCDPEPELFAATLQLHVDAGNIDAESIEELAEAYAAPCGPAEFVEALCARFRVAKTTEEKSL